MSEDRTLGSVTFLGDAHDGRYPYGHSLLVRGRERTLIIDPSLGLAEARAVPHADLVLLTHAHEDHMAAVHRYPQAEVLVHEADLPGVHALSGVLAMYGLRPSAERAFTPMLLEKFHYSARPDATAFGDGALIDLGATRVRALHTPGHTRGHCAFHVEPDDVLVLGDIDLSSFGPYYGDAWSSLSDFEASLRKVRALHARHYATFHHIGVLDERAVFLERLDRFEAMIASREERLLEFLRQPRTLAEIVAHRFVYRPGANSPFIDDVEEKSALQHLERLVARGAVTRTDALAYVRC